MEHSEEAVGEFVVAGGEGAVGFEMADAAFDPAAQAVESAVPADGARAVGARRDDGADVAAFQVGADGVAVVGLVAKQRAGFALRQVDQRVVGLAVVRLAAGEVEGERPAAGITDQVNLTGEPAPRAAKALSLSPPFAPAACGWPRTVVESML